MPDIPKYLNYYGWHIVSILLAAMAVCFGYAALYPSGVELAVLMTVLSALLAVWSLVLILWKRQSFLAMPQWIFFSVIAGIAIPGLLN